MHDPKMVAAIRAAMNDARMTGEDLPTAVLDALAAAGRLVPDGWVAVPREIQETPMEDAYHQARAEYDVMISERVFPRPLWVCFFWAAMLAAAPRAEDAA